MREGKIDLSRNWGCGKFWSFTPFRQTSLLFSFLTNKKTKAGSDPRVHQWRTEIQDFGVLSAELINNWLLYIYWKGGSHGLVPKKIISFTNQANFPKVSLWAGRLLPEMGPEPGPGSAILLGGHFQIREHYLGGHFSNFMKVVQSSNKRELKLNVTSANSKHWSYKRDCR